MTTAAPGATLITGQLLPPDRSVIIDVDWPEDFGNAHTLIVEVAGDPVTVSLEKVGDIPSQPDQGGAHTAGPQGRNGSAG